jgi:hypothetical protein
MHIMRRTRRLNVSTYCILAFASTWFLAALIGTAHAATVALPDQKLEAKIQAQAEAKLFREACVFWQKFRLALLSGDDKTLMGLIQSPLIVKGQTDFPPPRRVARGQTMKTVRRLLDQGVYVDDLRKRLPLRYLIETTPQLLPEHMVSPTLLEVYNMAFIKRKSGWKLVTVYDEES